MIVNSPALTGTPAPTAAVNGIPFTSSVASAGSMVRASIPIVVVFTSSSSATTRGETWDANANDGLIPSSDVKSATAPSLSPSPKRARPRSS